MTTNDKFTEIMKEMTDLRDLAIQRAADLKDEISDAINVLRRNSILGIGAQELISRFSLVETLPGISKEMIEDLIDGFRHYGENRRCEYVFLEGAARMSSVLAIDNLNRIIESKDAEIRAFEQQGRPIY